MKWIAVQCDDLGKQLFSLKGGGNFRSLSGSGAGVVRTRLAEKRLALLGVARIERETEPSHQVGHGGRLKDDGVLSRIEFLAVDAAQAFLDQYLGLLLAVQILQGHRTLGGPSGTGSFRV